MPARVGFSSGCRTRGRRSTRSGGTEAMATDIITVRLKQRERQAFTLIEILISVLLLSLSLAAMASLWGFSRKITERSRDTAEYFAIARQEIERDKLTGFQGLFTATGNVYVSSNNPRRSDYDPKGTLLATNLAAGAA